MDYNNTPWVRNYIVFLYYLFEYQFINTLAVPFFKNYLFDLGALFPIFAFLVIIGTSNGVNLTDGLDGLAVVPVITTAACLAFIAYLVGNKIFSEYLNLFFILLNLQFFGFIIKILLKPIKLLKMAKNILSLSFLIIKLSGIIMVSFIEKKENLLY